MLLRGSQITFYCHYIHKRLSRSIILSKTPVACPIVITAKVKYVIITYFQNTILTFKVPKGGRYWSCDLGVSDAPAPSCLIKLEIRRTFLCMTNHSNVSHQIHGCQEIKGLCKVPDNTTPCRSVRKTKINRRELFGLFFQSDGGKQEPQFLQ